MQQIKGVSRIFTYFCSLKEQDLSKKSIIEVINMQARQQDIKELIQLTDAD